MQNPPSEIKSLGSDTLFFISSEFSQRGAHLSRHSLDEGGSVPKTHEILRFQHLKAYINCESDCF